MSGHSTHQRQRFFRRYRHKIIPVLLTIAATALATTILVKVITEMEMNKMLNQQPLAVNPVAAVSPTPTPMATDAPRSGTGGGALDLMFLINFDHPAALQDPPHGVTSARVVMGADVRLKANDMRIDERAGMAAGEMFRAARAAGLQDLVLCSAYRSQAYQDNLFHKKLRQNPGYGSDPYREPVSVLPGSCSEHATGLAIDITTLSHPQLEETFAATPEGQWLYAHCWEYGFVLRYPKHKEGTTGVVYEPWHFRYVGVEAAREMTEKDLCLEEYLA